MMVGPDVADGCFLRLYFPCKPKNPAVIDVNCLLLGALVSHFRINPFFETSCRRILILGLIGCLILNMQKGMQL